MLRTWRTRLPRPSRRAELAVQDLYRELAVDRARTARTALAGERDRTRLFAQSAAALEEAAGAYFTTAPRPVSAGRGAVARRARRRSRGRRARFELAADITRARRAR